MRDWKAQANQAELMLTGAVPYDEAELRRILTGMVGDARDVEAGISGASAQALDVKGRFSQFEADAAATLQAAAARDGARARFQRVAGDCRSCHDALKQLSSPASASDPLILFLRETSNPCPSPALT